MERSPGSYRSKPAEQSNQPEKHQTPKEGVVDMFTRLMRDRAMEQAIKHTVKEIGREWQERIYKDLPSREEEARLLAEERKYLEQLTPDEQHQYHLNRFIRDLKNMRTMSDQVEHLSWKRLPSSVAELQQQDPEFMDPLVSALRQRPDWQRRERAMERLERMRQRRANESPQGSGSQS
jgi:hypothetical protein